jgi:hypothetical protein
MKRRPIAEGFAVQMTLDHAKMASKGWTIDLTSLRGGMAFETLPVSLRARSLRPRLSP